MKQLGKGVSNLKNISASEIVEVVQKYSNYVTSFCRRYYIAGGTDEDLFEEGVIGILEACKNYNGESVNEPRFDPFVKLCIRRQIFDAIKKSNTQKNRALNESLSLTSTDSNGKEKSVLDTLFDRNSSNDPLDIFIDKEKYNEKLAICERELSAFELEVLKHYLNGEKQSEIAKNLNRDVKSIDNTIQRIKSKMK